MFLTDALRAFAREKCGVAADAGDEAYRAALQKALGDGSLTPAEFGRLSTPPPNPALDLVRQAAEDAARKAVAGLDIAGQLTAALKSAFAGNPPPTPTPTPAPTPPATPPAGGQPITAADVGKAVEAALKGFGYAPNPASPHSLLVRGYAENGDPTQVRVKGAAEQYSTTKSAVLYRSGQNAGQQLVYEGRNIDTPSQRDKAIIGAWTRFCVGYAMRQPGYKMTEHEHDLVQYAIHEEKWSGFVGGDGDTGGVLVQGRKLTEFERKALLDDLVSGGANAVPLIYDDTPLMSPIMQGQLVPRVEIQTITRGTTVRAFTIGEPVISSGIPEGTPIPLMDTTGFIAAFDTSVYPVVGAVDIGVDFEADTPVNFGQVMIDRYGQVMRRWLDQMIVSGDGVTQPLGLFNTTSVVIVPSTFGPGGPVAISDIEGLNFGIAPNFRQNRQSATFVMNDVTYRRFRSIAVAAGWNERLMGTNYNDYTLFGIPVAIITTLPNKYAAFVDWSQYRLYRRQGMQVTVVDNTTSKENALKNLRTIVIRARWGGRLWQGGAAAMTLDLPN